MTRQQKLVPDMDNWRSKAATKSDLPIRRQPLVAKHDDARIEPSLAHRLEDVFGHRLTEIETDDFDAEFLSQRPDLKRHEGSPVARPQDSDFAQQQDQN